ncbi:TRAP transporter small permease subunit [Hwanghaeella grinnelliae]|uniref:TRAP transporter small permease protein n=2 Tax=Hwanghaeella grinnelliae TaxID=2500179 RepID=A0A3S2VSX0_9PROT|nr:TRAP transporter small permease subunit [Hwanghaeella grinnelliae]
MSVAWMAMLMVLVQFAVVVLRYIFGYGSIFMQESILYLHGFVFMLGASYALLHDGHVRVDIFYREASPETKAKIDIFGVLFFLIPVCTALFIYVLPYVQNSWAQLEGSNETSGIPARFILKTAIPVFCVLMSLQGVSIIIHSLNVLAGRETPKSDEEHEGI